MEGNKMKREVDVCIAGEPAINGVCGNPLCVCAPPARITPEQWFAITDAIAALPVTAAALEGGGAGCVYIGVELKDGSIICFGVANETWCGDVYLSLRDFEHGISQDSRDTDIPTTVTDPALLAAAFAKTFIS
jgi:hypothetical protein